MSNNHGKLFILVILILLSLSLAGFTFHFLEIEKAKVKDLTAQLKTVQQKNEAINRELANAKNLYTRLEVEYKDSRTRIDSLMKELIEIKNSNKDMIGEIAGLEERLEVVSDQRNIATQKNDELGAKLASAVRNAKRLEVRLSQVSLDNTVLQKEIDKFNQPVIGHTESIELEEIKVTPAVMTKTVPVVKEKKKAKTKKQSLEGKILVLNRDYDFVVISLGNKDGVKINDTFSVYRKNKHIGEISVEKVHETMAAAGFIAGTMKTVVNEGDRVVSIDK